MSQRLGRMLLRLYPSRIRQRYGDELLDLQNELRSEGDLSLLRLTRDGIAGALIARSATQRALILGGGLLIAGLIAVGVTLAGSGHRSNAAFYGSLKHPAVARLAATPAVPPSVPYGRSCLVSSGMSCSLRACSEYTASGPVRSTPTADAQALYRRDSRRARAVCVSRAYPSQAKPQTLYVNSASLSAGPSDEAHQGAAPTAS
jgi:hypothetical protein